MSVKLLSDSGDAEIGDEDRARIAAILEFWFKAKSLSAPQIDARMDVWFGESADFDAEIVDRFSADLEAAADGRLQHWATESQGSPI